MKILRVIVDELPETIEWCPFIMPHDEVGICYCQVSEGDGKNGIDYCHDCCGGSEDLSRPEWCPIQLEEKLPLDI